MVDLRSALDAAIQSLTVAGVTDPVVDAELLAGHVLSLSRGELQAQVLLGQSLSDEDSLEFQGFIDRRCRREPLQHITGRAPFRYLELQVGPGVFVPRPETELVTQFAIDALMATAQPAPVAVDLGTGSGAIALAMATEVPHSLVFAVEKSAQAHSWASRNTQGITNLTLVQGDLTDAFAELDGTVAVVISNPPYIPNDAIPRDVEVRLFDPELALYGGPDGLDIIRVISHRALQMLYSGGTLVLEHAETQGSQIRQLLRADGWLATATHPDLLGRDRATTAIRP